MAYGQAGDLAVRGPKAAIVSCNLLAVDPTDFIYFIQIKFSNAISQKSAPAIALLNG